MSTLTERITGYLSNGGFWNPEHMEHDKVRQLLIDCRGALVPAPCQKPGHLMLHWRQECTCGYTLQEHRNYMGDQTLPSACSTWKDGKAYCTLCAAESRAAIQSGDEMLNRILGALENPAWPNTGCDIEVAVAVNAIVARAVAATLEQAAQLCEEYATSNHVYGTVAYKIRALNVDPHYSERVRRLVEAAEPFTVSIREVEILKDLGRDDGKPRMTATLLSNKISDHQIIELYEAAAALRQVERRDG